MVLHIISWCGSSLVAWWTCLESEKQQCLSCDRVVGYLWVFVNFSCFTAILYSWSFTTDIKVFTCPHSDILYTGASWLQWIRHWRSHPQASHMQCCFRIHFNNPCYYEPNLCNEKSIILGSLVFLVKIPSSNSLISFLIYSSSYVFSLNWEECWHIFHFPVEWHLPIRIQEFILQYDNCWYKLWLIARNHLLVLCFLQLLFDTIFTYMNEFTVTEDLFQALQAQMKKYYYNEMIQPCRFSR